MCSGIGVESLGRMFVGPVAGVRVRDCGFEAFFPEVVFRTRHALAFSGLDELCSRTLAHEHSRKGLWTVNYCCHYDEVDHSNDDTDCNDFHDRSIFHRKVPQFSWTSR